jgi:hypothetical protein
MKSGFDKLLGLSQRDINLNDCQIDGLNRIFEERVKETRERVMKF